MLHDTENIQSDRSWLKQEFFLSKIFFKIDNTFTTNNKI